MLFSALSTITTLEEAAAAAAAAEAAAAAATAAAPTALGAGSGALMAGMTGAELAPATATAMPGVTAPLAAAAAPASDAAMANAGQGIMQGAGAAPGADASTAANMIQQDIVRNADMANQPAATPLPDVNQQAAAFNQAVDTSMANVNNAMAQQPAPSASGAAPGAPGGPLQQYAESARQSSGVSESAFNIPKANVESSIFDSFGGLGKGLRTALDFYKELPTPLQYLTAGLASQKLGLFEQEQPKRYKSKGIGGFKDVDWKNFRAAEPNPYLYGGKFAGGGMVDGVSPSPALPNYPMARQNHMAYAQPAVQNPISQNVLDVGDSNALDPYTGMPAYASG